MAMEKSAGLGAIIVTSPLFMDPVPLIVERRPNLGVDATTIDRSNLMLPKWSPQPSKVAELSYSLSFTCELTGEKHEDIHKLAPLLTACNLVWAPVFYVTGSLSGTFQRGETVTDGSSHPFIVLAEFGSLLLLKQDPNMPEYPSNGDTLTGSSSGATLSNISVVNGSMFMPRTATNPAPELLEITFWQDGIKHAIREPIGNVQFNFTVKEVPKVTFEFQGLYSDPVDDDSIADMVSSLQLVNPPVCVGAEIRSDEFQNVSCLLSLEMNVNNKITPVDCMQAETGKKGFIFTGRDPSGTIKPYVYDISTFNPWEKFKAGETFDILLLAGDTPGNRVGLYIPNASYNGISYEEQNDLLVYNLPFKPTGTNDDEFYLLFF